MSLRRCFIVCCLVLAGACTATAGVVISEIMFHPAGVPENTAGEWIEIHNASSDAVDLSEAKLTKGVSFAFAAGTTLAPNAYVIVAADVAAFRATHPGIDNVVGGWTGRLSNSGEAIRLEDGAGLPLDEIRYADEGDWGMRMRGPSSFGHEGWEWVSRADGGGSSLELRNPGLASSGSGQNWGMSMAAGGTPGAVNSLTASDVAPLIMGTKHEPEVPRAGQSVTVSAEIVDETGAFAATLHWREEGGSWQIRTMSDSNGDGTQEATIPGRPHLTVIEYYIAATDGTNARTWPAPARTSAPGVSPETFAQATNALLQYDDSFDPNADFTAAGNQPIYRVIMTAAERAELARIGSVSAESESEAAMNATFISQGGTGVKVRYLAGIRNRGFSSRLAPPGTTSNNYYVGFRSDDPWEGRASIQINYRYPHSQALGALLMDRAGIAPQSAAIVQVRINGSNLAAAGALQYGRYVRIEPLNDDWTVRHYPNDADGNLYRLDDHAPNAPGDPPGDLGSGEFRYEGTNPAAYADTFFKRTNEDADNWSDLIDLASKLTNTPDAAFPSVVSQVLDLEQFYTFIAADALIGNQEGGLQSGRADDAGIYRGILDPRFKLVPHDFDDVFNIGGEAGDGRTRSIFSYDAASGGVQGLRTLFNHPELVPRYYAKVLEGMDTWFNHAVLDPLIEQVMGGWVPAATINNVKGFIDVRRANVLAEIEQNYSLTVTTGAPDFGGFKQTNDGSATIGGTFNVARTYSIRVNGVPAQIFYRTSGADPAGTWKLVIAASAGFFNPGLNKVVVNFYDQPNGGGRVLTQLTADVYFPGSGITTQIAGSLSPRTVTLLAPASYVPGVPFLVRVELKDAEGNLDRGAWNRTAILTGSGGVTVSPSTVALYNGVGSALVSVSGGGTGGGQTQLVAHGGTLQAPNDPSATWTFLDTGAAPAAAWKSDPLFDETGWKSGHGQFGSGDADERTVVANVSSAAGSRRTWYFRHRFNVASPGSFTDATLRVLYDDGIAIYLNGNELKRLNLIDNASDSTAATLNRVPPAEGSFETYAIPAGALQTGDNLIAVELHNANASVDLSFDLQLIGNLSSGDPGNLTLTANLGGTVASKAVTSLGGQPQTSVSGTLAGNVIWSGIVNVTADVTIPSGAILTIQPGTHVLMAGTTAPGDTSGADLIIQGALNALGTAAQPISIASADPAARWGEVFFTTAQPATLTHCLISHGGHSPGRGHTGRGPMVRLNSSSLTFEDSVLADGPAKAVYTSGNCNLTIRRSLITRMITGPELEDGTSLLIEDSNIQDILPNFRESNASAPDDEDCLYVHNSSGRPVTVRRSIFAKCGDDLFDCLGGLITVEDCILRDGWDKGMSLLNNDLNVSRTLIIDCDKAIVPKGSTASTRTINVDRVTIVGEDHDTSQAPFGYPIPPNNPDADTVSTGLYTQDKSGQSDPGATLTVTATNSIILAKEPVKVDAIYPAANTVVNYSNTFDLDSAGAPAWPGTGNIAADPLFVDAAGKDFHLRDTSPSRDTGDPAAPLDGDGSRADMGALPFGSVAVTTGTITWTPAGGPYNVTGNVTVPVGTTLIIQPGTTVYFDPGRRLTINGRILAEGSANARIVFSHVPGAIAAGDADPVKNGVQTGPPKWGGVRVFDAMAQESIFSYCDFINAQGTSTAGQENFGSLGFIRSWGRVDHCTWAGTHLRMCYGRNSKLTVTHSVFPDMFLFDPVLGRIEDPTDFLTSLDNNMEPLKVEFPTTDPEVLGANAPNFPNGQPFGGHWRVYYNDFYGNRGHNDVFDADSGRWGQPGQFMLDCRYNHFHGLSGDEHIDLGGDAYIASNIFERATKDQWVSAFGTDLGYSNAISSGDKGEGTTIMVVRNLFFDLDHAINCKARTATIFEHNTVANFHPDYLYTQSDPDQNVKCAPVNFFVPEDGTNPTYGDGAYLGFNLVSNTPHLFSGPDARKVGGTLVNDITTKIEFFHNLLDQIADSVIGPNHPGGFFSGSYGPNSAGAADFVDPAAKDFALQTGSPARGTAPGGLDYGWTVPEWAYIVDGPASQTSATTASFIIGGPGIVAYQWRLDGGAWSPPVQIGSGGVFPRTGPTVRQATLDLTGLPNGPHTLEVLGQDMAGNWQDADPARTVEGLAQASPTAWTWTVNTSLQLIRINEVLADSNAAPDAIELYNGGAAAVNIGGWTLSDDPLVPAKFTIPADTILPAGGYSTFLSTTTGIALGRDGDSIFLRNGEAFVDSITFGRQVRDLTIGRIGPGGEWMLCTPTLGSANTAQRVGDPSGVRINEWFTSGDVLYDNDWIELANPGALPVSLSGLRLTDNHTGSPAQHTIAPLSFIAANGFAKFIADGKPQASPTHLSFMLDAEQEQIALFDDSRQLDLVFFYPQTVDYSMGRDPGSQTGYAFFELPTAGLVNGTDDPAYINALALLRGLRITELMYNPIGGPEFEFIELRNVGSTALQLGGVRFVQGIDFTFPTMTLAPGQNVVLVSNVTEFRERYGTSVHLGGVYAGRLDNTGETLALQLPPPFDANILTFSYDDAWQPATDGLGRSLVVRNPLVPASLWKDRTAWQASFTNGGDPDGVALPAPDRFPAWMTFYGINEGQSDTDHDGISALLEYALGTHPLVPSDSDGPASLPQISLTADGRVEFRFIVPGNPAAAQLHGAADLSYAIEASDDLAIWTVIATKTFAAAWGGPATVTAGSLSDGSFLVVVHDVAGSERRYLRLRVSLLP